MKAKRYTIAYVLALSLALMLAWLILGTRPPDAVAAPQDPTAGVIYVDADSTGPADGLAWSTAFTNLQDALSSAAPGDEIWVAEGVYTPTYLTDAGNARTATFVLTDGVALYGGFAATETLRAQRDWKSHVTVLSGDLDSNDITDGDGVVIAVGSNAYHVVTAVSVTETARLDGFLITGGRANGSPPYISGGGMNNDGGSPTLVNITFSGNYAGTSGGGMSNDGSPTLIGVTFRSNSASLWGGGMINVTSSPRLTDVVFSDNSAPYGGGMDNHLSSPVMTNVIFSGNSAMYDGGGMYNIDDSRPQLTNVTFRGNTAGRGGGMYDHYSSPRLINVSFNGNSARYGGGGMLDLRGSPALTNVVFGGNTAETGGGMYVNRSNPSQTNVTLSGNSATTSGGAMYSYSSGPVFVNCILWGNEANGNTDQSAQVHLTGTSFITVTYSLVEGGVYTGSGNISADPQFVRDPDPGDGDWTTLDDNDYGDLRLQPWSPAIDAGDNAAIPASVTTDLDGNPRRFDAPFVVDAGSGTSPIVDVGAYEWHPYGNRVLLPIVLKE